MGSQKNITLTGFSFSYRPQSLSKFYKRFLQFSLFLSNLKQDWTAFFWPITERLLNWKWSKKWLKKELSTSIFCVFELLLSWLELSFHLSFKVEDLRNFVVTESLDMCKVAKINFLRFYKKTSYYPKNVLIFDHLQWFFDNNLETANF